MQRSLHDYFHGSSNAPPRGRELRESSSSLSLDAFRLTIFHVNVDGFTSRKNELEARLAILLELPAVVSLNETKLDDSCPFPSLASYSILCRRDRNSSGGGVIVFVRDCHAHLFSPLPPSPSAEIAWFLFHSDCGPILCAGLYRPPCYGEVQSLECLVSEWVQLSP